MPDLYVAKPPNQPSSRKSLPESESVRPAGLKEPIKTKSTLKLPNGIASFIVKPKNIHFENQKESETILLLLRRHWVTNLPWVVGSVILLFCPLVLNYLPGVSLFPVRYKLVAFIGWYLLIAAFVFTRFLNWFFNVGIVTDKRIVDVDFFGLLYKEITSADLNKIQDVSQQQVGAVRALFDFGDIFVQTASETAKIEFEAIPHPARVIDLIDNLT